MCCVDIIIKDKEILDAAPSHMLKDGVLKVTTSLSITRKREKVNDSGKIQGQGSYAVNFDFTKKHNFIFERLFNPFKIERKKGIEISAVFGGSVLNYDYLIPVSKNDSYEVQLIDSSVSWKATTKEIYLNTENYASFTFEHSEFLSNWGNPSNYKHDGTGDGYVFGMVDYGGVRNAGIDLIDLDPLFNIMHLVDNLICLSGWTFESDVWRGEWGLRQVINLVKDRPSVEWLQSILINRFIDNELTLYDLLVDMAKMIDGEFITDYKTRTIYLNPRNRGVIHNESFDSNSDKGSIVSLDIICDSAKVVYNNKKTKRYRVDGFKQQKDLYTISQGYTRKNPLYGVTFDLGAGFIEGTTYNESNLFEASLDKPLEQNNISSPIVIPVAWDNEYGENRSVSIQHRIFTAVGFVRQIDIIAPIQTYNQYHYFYTALDETPTTVFNQEFLPYVSQCPILTDHPTFDGYGDDSKNYPIFYRLTDLEQLTIEYLVKLSYNEFKQLKFWDKVVIEHEGNELEVQIEEIKDFRLCEDLTTPMTFKTKSIC